MKRQIFTLHRWAGLLSGIFLLLIGLSGSLLVFKQPLNRWLYPSLSTRESVGSRISLDSAYHIVYRKYAADFISCSLDIPAGKNDLFEFTLEKHPGSLFSRRSYLVDLHPSTGAILREGYCSDISSSVTHWLMYFHDSFHFGKAGMLIVALSSLAIFLSMITGLLFYGKSIVNVLTFRISLRSKSRVQFWRSLHLYIGVWALILNGVIFCTGFWMVKSVLNPASWKSPGGEARTMLPVSIDSCLARSKTLLPGFTPDFLMIPFTRNEFLEFDGNMEGESRIFWGDASSVVWDPRNGNVVETKDASVSPFPQKLAAAVWPLHVGNYGGMGVRIVYAIGGLIPGVISLSGYLIWWKRRRIYVSVRR